jgi:hypothetical protein
MSSTHYKVPYTDNSDPMGYSGPRDRAFYVHQHNTSDVTTIYDDRGEVVYQWHIDNDNEAELLARIISGQINAGNAEPWDGKFEAV